jgi:hypothetical protein
LVGTTSCCQNRSHAPRTRSPIVMRGLVNSSCCAGRRTRSIGTYLLMRGRRRKTRIAVSPNGPRRVQRGRYSLRPRCTAQESPRLACAPSRLSAPGARAFAAYGWEQPEIAGRRPMHPRRRTFGGCLQNRLATRLKFAEVGPPSAILYVTPERRSSTALLTVVRQSSLVTIPFAPLSTTLRTLRRSAHLRQ